MQETIEDKSQTNGTESESIGSSNQESIDRPLSDKEKAEIFRTAIEEGVQSALELVKERFENTPDEYDKLEFHNVRHTTDVVRRFDSILDVVKKYAPDLYNERSHKIGRLGAAHHDTVQKWEPIATPSTNQGEEGLIKIIRKRFAGQNEAESTEGAIALMDKVNEEAKTEIFTEEDKTIIRGGHEATIPGFNIEKNTVIQPKLDEESSIITRAIALSDLGTAGMDGPEAYLPEGDALFREENIDIADALKSPESLNDAKKSFFQKRMLGWSSFQAKFAEGRKEMLEEEIRPLPKGLQEEISKLFDKFDDSIASAKEQSVRRESMTFEELAEDMGYRLGKEAVE